MVLTIVDSTVGPCLKTEAVLLVILPLADVLGAVGMSVGSMTVGLIVNPFAFINVTICVEELTEAIGFAVAPVTLVAGAIEPVLLTLAVTDTVQPFAFVDRTAIQVDGRAQLSDILGKGLFRLRCGAVIVSHERVLVVVVIINYTMSSTHAHELITLNTLFLIDGLSLLHLVGVNAVHGAFIFTRAVGKNT